MNNKRLNGVHLLVYIMISILAIYLMYSITINNENNTKINVSSIKSTEGVYTSIGSDWNTHESISVLDMSDTVVRNTVVYELSEALDGRSNYSSINTLMNSDDYKNLTLDQFEGEVRNLLFYRILIQYLTIDEAKSSCVQLANLVVYSKLHEDNSFKTRFQDESRISTYIDDLCTSY